MKKKMCLFLSTVILSVAIFNSSAISVCAEPQIDKDSVRSQIYWGITQAAGTLGYLFGPNAREAIYDFARNSLSWLPTYEETGTSDRVTYDPSTGMMVFTTQAIAELKATIEDYFAQETNLPDVVWMPVLKSSDIPSTLFYTTTLYYQVRSYVDAHKISAISSRNGDYYVYCADASEYVVISCGWNTNYNTIQNWTNHFGDALGYSCVCGFFATRDGISKDNTGIPYDGYYNPDGSGFVSTDNRYLAKNNSYGERYLSVVYPFANIPWSNYSDNYCYLFVSDDAGFSYVPIFKTLDAYKQWVTGQSDYYRVTPTYDGGDITINPNADYSKVYNNITTTIQNNYADGKDYSDILAAIQLAYAESMKEISAGLDDIGGNTEEANSWLEQIKKNTDALIDPDGGSWLARIYEQETAIKDSIDKGFADLLGILSIDDVDDPGGTGGGTGGGGSSGGDDSGGGGSNKTFWNKLGDFASGVVTVILDLISTVVFKAMDGLDYLLGILMDNIDLVFTEMALVFGRLNNAMIVGNGFYASIYGHMPEVARDMIAYLTFCFVCAAVIRTLKG